MLSNTDIKKVRYLKNGWENDNFTDGADYKVLGLCYKNCLSYILINDKDILSIENVKQFKVVEIKEVD